MAFCMRGRVAMLRVAHPPVNSLSLAARKALMEGIDAAEREGAQALVISGAGATFPAGADIAEFSNGGHLVAPTLNCLVERLHGLRIHTVAALHGTALGGGLELALACHWRVALPSAQLGFPEVGLGVLPGAGGTQSLPRLVPLDVAVQMVTSGSPLSADAALAAGLVDELLPPAAAANAADAAASGGYSLAARLAPLPFDPSRSLPLRPAPTAPGGADAFFSEAAARVRHGARGLHAPLLALEAVRAAVEAPTYAAGREAEAALFLQLAAGEQAAALQHAFFAERAMSKARGGGEAADIARAAVVGAGTMGCGIAMCFANAGVAVTLVEVGEAALARGLEGIRAVYEASERKGKLPGGVEARMRLIGGATTLDVPALREADIVVEAAFEQMDVKKEIFGKLDALCKPTAILASNTSYLDIDEIAAATSRPQLVAGMHFFSPAHVMPLLENVKGKQTSSDTIATIMQLGKRLKKKAVLAGNCNGFIGNRMLEGYVAEALFMLEEGCTPSEVDAAMRGFGMPMGPLEMSDLAGNDIGYMARRNHPRPTERYAGGIADRLVEMKRRVALGQKSKAGWYDYSAGKKPRDDPAVQALIEGYCREHNLVRRQIAEEEERCCLRAPTPPARPQPQPPPRVRTIKSATTQSPLPPQVVDRCLLPLVNEGFKVLEEGIAQRESDIDMVYLFGYGFPRYKGGPMYWARHIRPGGLPKVLSDLEKYGAVHTNVSHWKPAELLLKVASDVTATSKL
ncbi:hypothetical protein AB1Y20_015677 [Prymnesium parvum]|uniref:Enoyl-CoA hydratase n=1 Tax=Prymnesium parvum TaxID=97485 RepID=A0AB34K1H6_PRYPA